MKAISIIFVPAALMLASLAVAEMSGLPYEGKGHIIMDTSQLEWKDVPSMASGAKMAIIEGDLSKAAPFTFRLKLPADYTLAPHTHPAHERVTILSGSLHFAQGDTFDRTKTEALEAGDIAIMPPATPMFGYTEEETLIQLHGTGPWGIKYLNPSDDPRN